MINLKRKVRYYQRRFGMWGHYEMNKKIPIGVSDYEKILLSLKPTKKRRGKNPLVRFGRYREMERNIFLFKQTQNASYLLTAQKLRKNLTRPYRLKVRYANEVKEYQYPATVAFDIIKKLSTVASTVKSFAEFEKLEMEINRWSHVS